MKFYGGSMTKTAVKLGDFTEVAANYSKYRPKYSDSVMASLLGYVGSKNIDCVDIGAGTGIWTRMLANSVAGKVYAVEPNDNMREFGIKDSAGTKIEWFKGSAEATLLPSECCDLVSMASSFHWADFDMATAEFARLLRPNGCFVAIWNPRFLEENTLLLEIENYLKSLAPNMKRVSSGSSEFVNALTARLRHSKYFEDVVYMEGYHNQHFTKESYIGVWESVNDVRHNLGEDLFKQFIEYIDSKIADTEVINVTYKTRAWIARKK